MDKSNVILPIKAVNLLPSQLPISFTFGSFPSRSQVASLRGPPIIMFMLDPEMFIPGSCPDAASMACIYMLCNNAPNNSSNMTWFFAKFLALHVHANVSWRCGDVVPACIMKQTSLHFQSHIFKATKIGKKTPTAVEGASVGSVILDCILADC